MANVTIIALEWEAKKGWLEKWSLQRTWTKLNLTARYYFKGRITLPKRMNFWKSSKRGGAVISNPKIYVADFGHLNRAF